LPDNERLKLHRDSWQPEQKSSIKGQLSLGSRVTRLGEISLLYWVIIYIGRLYENYRNSPEFLATFSSIEVIINFNKKCIGWATSWAIF
jgi:hypothetical protein